MRTFILTLFIAIIFLNDSVGQGQVDTLEAHRLWKEGKEMELAEKFENAAIKFRRASKIFYRQGFDVRYADCISSENICEMSKQQSFLSDSLLHSAINIYKEKLGENHLKLVRPWCFLGFYSLLHKDRNQVLYYYNKALKVLKRSMSNVQNPPKNLSRLVVKVFNGLAIAYEQQGDFNKAKSNYEIGIVIAKKNNLNRRLGSLYMNVAGIYSRRGQYELAIDHYKKAIKEFGRKIEGPFKNIAGLYKRLKKFDQAEKYYDISLEIVKKRYKGKHPNIAHVYFSKALLSKNRGGVTKALSYFQKGLYYNSNSLKDSVNVFYRNDKAYQDYKLVFLQTALLRFKAATLSIFSNDMKYLKEALYNYQLCDSIVEQIKFTRPQLYDRYINDFYKNKVYLNISNLCTSLYVKSGVSYYQQLAFYFAEKSHSNFLAKSLHARKAKREANLPDSIVNQEMYLQQQFSYFQRKLLTEKNAIQKQAYQDSLFEYNQQREALNELLSKKFPKYYRLRFQNTPATVAQIQDKLDKRTILLNYVFGAKESRVFVITKDAFQIVPLASQDQVTKVLNRYYESIQSEAQLSNFVAESYAVYQTLFQPVQAFLRGKQKLVITNPTLLSVPLGAVVDQKNKASLSKFATLAYLVKKYAISYHYSASLWWQSGGDTSESDAKPSFIGMAPFSGGEGKVVTTRGNQGLLPESKKEINSIYNFFKQKKLYAEAYLSKAATRHQFLTKVKDFDILHIASHSTANLKEERLAKIHFAPQQQADSTYLYAESIYYLPLKAQLVVLSSCESGVGKFAPGEGVMSLARGFLHAGAKNVISSLWEADDQYTKKLMVLLYQQLLFRHKTYPQALHTAKVQLIAQEPYLHPKYWSSFILIGR